MMNTYYVSCAQGLAPLVLDELKALSIEGKLQATGVTFTGEIREAYQICLWSRCASRVLQQLQTGSFSDCDRLYQQLLSFAWHQHVSATGTFVVEVSTKRAQVHTQYAAQRVKDAIVDFFQQRFALRPSVSKQRPDVTFHLHIEEKSYALFVDLSGSALHQRGFRQQTGSAPIKENLAAALLYKRNWPVLAAENANFYDPFCGAGTILIEAAMMAIDMAPGLLRQYYGFLGWKGHQAEVWADCLAEARARLAVGKLRFKGRLVGIEKSFDILNFAKENAQQAGIETMIEFQHAYFETVIPEIDQTQRLLIVTNPPYGERLGSEEALIPTYQAFGDWLKQYFVGAEVGMIIYHESLGKSLGLRAKKINQFFNGALECRYLWLDIQPEYFVDRVLAAQKQQSRQREALMAIGGQDFLNRLQKNRLKWQKWAMQQGIVAYRVYDADLPDFNVAIDRYGDALVVQEYVAPKTIAPEKATARFEAVLSLLPEVYPDIQAEYIFIKKRQQQKGQQQYERLDEASAHFQIREGQAIVWVNLSDYLDTGLFLDHRNVRLDIAKRAKNKRFLNLFCYTATASVQAALGGASETHSVDMSKTYLEWARDNFELNHLPVAEIERFSVRQQRPRKDRAPHQLIQANVLEWLSQRCDLLEDLPLMQRRAQKYDLIFLDPPAFSNSKRMEDILDIQQAHEALIEDCMTLLNHDGLLIFSTNLRKFRLNEALETRYQVEDVSLQTLPEDFKRHPKIRQCFYIRHQLL